MTKFPFIPEGPEPARFEIHTLPDVGKTVVVLDANTGKVVKSFATKELADQWVFEYYMKIARPDPPPSRFDREDPV